eukprot:m.1956 g.1956  ORF g.1956 m.1956 type:complete len:416 (-) comp2358_c0_seq1:71-1318(-)
MSSEWRGVSQIGPRVVDALVRRSEQTLLIDLVDQETAERFHGEYTAEYIDELTRKTGSHKPLATFAAMIIAGLARSSSCLTLELLTYADLEAIRQRKRTEGGPQLDQSQITLANSSKRYLILTYETEFDRVHFPLTLTKNDAAPASSAHQAPLPARSPAPLSYQQHQDDEELADQAWRLAGAQKEIRLLKKVIANLESDFLTEKNKFQRTIQRKQAEQDALATELEDLRAVERNLRARCRSLTADLAKLRAAPPTTRTSHSPSPTTRRAGSKQSPATIPKRSPSPAAGNSKYPPTHGGSRPRAGSRSQSPSSRFDPTAYIHSREERLLEAKLRREHPRSRSGSPSARAMSPSGPYASRTSQPSQSQAFPGATRVRPPALAGTEQTQSFHEADAEISGITARLKALQSYFDEARAS